MTSTLRTKVVLLVATLFLLTACSVENLPVPLASSSKIPNNVMRLGFSIDTNTFDMQLLSVDGVSANSLSTQAINPMLSFSFLNTATNTGNCVPANPSAGAAGTMVVEFCFKNDTTDTFSSFSYRQHGSSNNVDSSTHATNTLPTDSSWIAGQATFDEGADGSLAPGEETKPQTFVVDYTNPGLVKFYVDVGAAETILNEPFDVATQFVYADTTSPNTPLALFSDTDRDFVTITDGNGSSSDGNGINPNYELIGFNGNFFAAQDIDDGNSRPRPATLTWSNISITGFTNLSMSVLVAEDDSSDGLEDWDVGDSVIFEYSINGGAFQNLLAFESDTTFGGTNGQPLQDTNFDGDGDGTALTSVAQTFSANIAGTGTTLTLRLTIDLGAGDEDIAIDDIVISGI